MVPARRPRILPLTFQVFLLGGWLLYLDQVEIDIITPLAPPDSVDEEALLTRLAIGGFQGRIALSGRQDATDDLSLSLSCQPLAVLPTRLQVYHAFERSSRRCIKRLGSKASWDHRSCSADFSELHVALSVVDYLHRGVFVRDRLQSLSLHFIVRLLLVCLCYFRADMGVRQR